MPNPNRIGPPVAATETCALLFVLGAVVITFLLRGKKRGVATVGVGVLALVSAVPGVSWWLTMRRDSPSRVAEQAERMTRFSERLEAFADGHGCTTVQDDTCPLCDPVVRFSLATMEPCKKPASVVLHADALSSGCLEGTDSLVCGPRHALP